MLLVSVDLLLVTNTENLHEALKWAVTTLIYLVYIVV